QPSAWGDAGFRHVQGKPRGFPRAVRTRFDGGVAVRRERRLPGPANCRPVNAAPALAILASGTGGAPTDPPPLARRLAMRDTPGMSDDRAAMLEGLNLFRALEAWGAALYA